MGLPSCGGFGWAGAGAGRELGAEGWEAEKRNGIRETSPTLSATQVSKALSRGSIKLKETKSKPFL